MISQWGWGRACVHGQWMEHCGEFMPTCSDSTLPLRVPHSVKSYRAGLPEAKRLVLCAYPLPAASLPYTASYWLVVIGLLFGLAWRGDCFLGCCLLMETDLQWVRPWVFWACPGMPESWDEHNLISQAGTRYTCFCASMIYLSQALKLFYLPFL